MGHHSAFSWIMMMLTTGQDPLIQPLLPKPSPECGHAVGHWRTDCTTLPRQHKVSVFQVPLPQELFTFWPWWSLLFWYFCLQCFGDLNMASWASYYFFNKFRITWSVLKYNLLVLLGSLIVPMATLAVTLSAWPYETTRSSHKAITSLLAHLVRI